MQSGIMTSKEPRTVQHRLRLSFTVVVEPDGDGFHAYCPAFKGLHVDGRDQKQALANAVRATAVYLESLARTNEPLPVGPDLVFKRQEVPQVPAGAFLHHVELQWPLQSTSGIR